MAWKNFSRSRQRNDFFFFLFSFRTQLLSWNFSPQLLSIKIDSQTSPPFSSFLFQPSLPALFSKGIYPSTRTLVNYFLDKLIRSAKLSFILQDPFRKKERERGRKKKKISRVDILDISWVAKREGEGRGSLCDLSVSKELMEFREDYAGSKFPHRFLVQISPRALARRGNRPWHGANSCQMRDAMKKGWQLNGGDFIKTRRTCAPAKTPPFLSHEERKKKKRKEKGSTGSRARHRPNFRSKNCVSGPGNGDAVSLQRFHSIVFRFQKFRRGGGVLFLFFFFLDRSNRLIRFPSGCSIKRIIVRWFNIAYWLPIHRRYCYIRVYRNFCEIVF